jgi:hypothetical protein
MKEIIGIKHDVKEKIAALINENKDSTAAFSDEDFKLLKSHFGEIIELEIEGKTFAFYPPDEFLMNKAAQAVSEGEFVESGNIIVLNTCLNGLNVIRDDEDIRKALRSKVNEIVATKKVVVKKR